MARETPEAAGAERPASTVARALAGTLDCAVLAMRYPVEDEFATELAESVYDGLFTKKQALPRAVQLGLAKASGGTGGALARAAGALSVAAPALFGAKAASLTLVPPKQPPRPFAVPDAGLAYFPPEPTQFVGRVSAMTRGSAALAAESTKSGVLFHGMAGAGKSSCAVELAYHHEAAGRFRAFVWYRAPEEGKDIALALRDFAVQMEKQLLGLSMVHVVDSIDALRDWLPRLTESLEQNGILLVLDNLESLLTTTGQWRDERWGLLINALLTPGGLSRAVLTSRTRPAELPNSTEVIALHALPLDEAVLLMRELPNLRRLPDGTASGVSVTEGREMMRRTLLLVQGHPKLIELADRLAADPRRLSAQLGRADAAQGQGELDAFFHEGETRFAADAFTTVLRGWTAGIAGELPENARTFFYFVCAIEEADRESWVLEANWSDLWKRLGRPEPAPAVLEMLAPLVAAGLVEKEMSTPDDEAFTVTIHPGVAEGGRADGGPEFQAAVDEELAATWGAVMARGLNAYTKEHNAGSMIVRAGLAAFPYLSRLQKWELAAEMIDEVVRIDQTPATITAVLPCVRRIAAATAGTEQELSHQGLLANVLECAGRTPEAEALLRALLKRAVEKEKFTQASGLAGVLANLLRCTGRTSEALTIIESKTDYTRRAGLGPWTRLADEAWRLQLLNVLGKYDEVMRRVTELRDEMKILPDPPGSNETVYVWNVREATLDTGHSAAISLEQWQQALDLNAELLQSKRMRGATPLEQAKFRFNDYAPLLRLGRHADAGSILTECRAVFERENAIDALGRVFSALGNLENNLAHRAEARRFEETALRFKYIAGDPRDIGVSHFNLANYITRDKGAWRDALAHRLAAVLISVLTGEGKVGARISALVHNLRDTRRAGGPAMLPANFAMLCATVEQVEGVRFRELVERLAAGQTNGDDLLKNVVAMAAEAMEQTTKGSAQNSDQET